MSCEWEGSHCSRPFSFIPSTRLEMKNWDLNVQLFNIELSNPVEVFSSSLFKNFSQRLSNPPSTRLWNRSVNAPLTRKRTRKVARAKATSTRSPQSYSPCPCFNETLETNDANQGPRRCRLKNGGKEKRRDRRAKLRITPGSFMIKTLYLPSILLAFASNLIHWSEMFC